MAEGNNRQPDELVEVRFNSLNYLSALWRAKWLFLAVAVVATTVAVVHTRRQPKIYESTCTLIFTDADSAQASMLGGDAKSDAPKPLFLSPEVYLQIAMTNEVMTEIVHSLELDRPPYRMTPDSIRGGFNLRAEAKDRILRVSYGHSNPELVDRIANSMGDALVKISRKIQANRFNEMKDYLTSALHSVKTSMDKVVTDLDRVEKRVQLSLLKSDLQDAQAVLSTAGPTLNEINQTIIDATAQLEVVKASLSEARSRAGDTASPPIQKPDSIDSLVREAQSLKLKLEPTLAGMKAKREALEKGKDRNAKAVLKLESEIRTVERQMSILQTQYEVLSTSYTALARKIEETRIMAAASVAPNLMILDPALPPQGPIDPGLRKKVLSANLFCFALLAFSVLMVDAIRKKRASLKG